MDYNDIELIAFCVLSIVPAVLLIIVGVVAHVRSFKEWIPVYLVLGIFGCCLYALFMGALILELFPPPKSPVISGGWGLDFRGIGIVIGTWIGALVGIVSALITAAISSLVLRIRARRALS